MRIAFLMKKNLKKVIDQTVKKALLDYVRYTAAFVLIFFLLLYLVLNIYAPQQFPPLYFSLVDSNETAMVTYLQKIYKTPLFTQFFFLDQDANGRLLQEIRRDEVARENRITAYQQALLLNPQDRDILLALSRLYGQNGDNKKAGEYLRQAQAIDPMVK